MNGTIIAGALLLVVTISFGVASLFFLNEEERVASAAKPYSPELKPGEQVYLEGRVASTNPLLTHDFVAAEREVYQTGAGSQKGGWKIVETFTGPLHIDVPGLSAPVLVENPYPAASGGSAKELDLPGEKRQRLRGIGRGATFSAVGTVVSQNPPVVKATYNFADTWENYRTNVRDANTVVYAFTGVMALASLGIILKGVWKP